MEAELREALKEIKTTMDTGQAKLEAKMDMANQQSNAHLIDDARNFQRLEMQSDAMHTRMDEESTERKSRRSNWWAMWLTVVGAFLAALFALIVSVAGKKG